jgi:hypothetical protein
MVARTDDHPGDRLGDILFGGQLAAGVEDLGIGPAIVREQRHDVLHEDLSWAGTGTIYAATLPSASDAKKFKSRRPSHSQPTTGIGIVNQSGRQDGY